jgi:hypothetical protein
MLDLFLENNFIYGDAVMAKWEELKTRKATQTKRDTMPETGEYIGDLDKSANYPVVTYAILPEVSKFGPFQGFSDASRVITFGNTFFEELKYALRALRIKFVQFAHGGVFDFNRPGHSAALLCREERYVSGRTEDSSSGFPPEINLQGHPGVPVALPLCKMFHFGRFVQQGAAAVKKYHPAKEGIQQS